MIGAGVMTYLSLETPAGFGLHSFLMRAGGICPGSFEKVLSILYSNSHFQNSYIVTNQPNHFALSTRQSPIWPKNGKETAM
jgi:hypothetical protein